MYKEKAASKSKTEVITVVAIYHDVPTVPTYGTTVGTYGTVLTVGTVGTSILM